MFGSTIKLLLIITYKYVHFSRVILYFQSNDTDVALNGGITTIPAQKMSVFTT